MNETGSALTWLEYTVDEDKKASVTQGQFGPDVHIIAALRTLGVYEDDLLGDLSNEPPVLHCAEAMSASYHQVVQLMKTLEETWPDDLAAFAETSARLSVAAVEAHDDHKSLLRAVKNTFVTMGLIPKFNQEDEEKGHG